MRLTNVTKGDIRIGVITKEADETSSKVWSEGGVADIGGKPSGGGEMGGGDSRIGWGCITSTSNLCPFLQWSSVPLMK